MYYAPCEYATPVLSMFDMEREGLAGLSLHEKEHQILQFKTMLDQILSHSKTECMDNFIIIYFKGTRSSLLIICIRVYCILVPECAFVVCIGRTFIVVSLYSLIKCALIFVFFSDLFR